MNSRWVELTWRFSLPVFVVLWLPGCLAIGWLIRKWDLDLGFWLSVRLAIWEILHDKLEQAWHWSYRVGLSKAHAERNKKKNAQLVKLENVTIGQYADYLDTGIWTVKDGQLVPPPDLTPRQANDFQRVFGRLEK